MIYLASPYYHTDPNIRTERYHAVHRATALWIKSGLNIYSPIVYTHSMAVTFSMPTDHKFWRDFNMSWLRRCNELWILKLDGWEQSEGITAEREEAERIGLKITEVDVP